MSTIEARLRALGLSLPPPMLLPAGVVLPFEFACIRGTRVLFSGHLPQNQDGSLAQPLGRIGSELSVEQGYGAARLTALSILGTLQRLLGTLDRVSRWNRVFGMVNSAAGFNSQPAVINGCSDLILQLFGPERGAHTRSAVGVAELPFRVPVEIEGEIEIEAAV